LKCLSISQPFTDLIILGKKNIELRSWNTNFRGEFLIHAPLKIKIEDAKRLKINKKFITGAIIGKAELYEVKKYNSIKEITLDKKFHLSSKKFQNKVYGFMLKNVSNKDEIAIAPKSSILKMIKNTDSSKDYDNSNDELEQIKKQVDLVSKAYEFGYKVIDKESDSNYTIMKDGATTVVIKNNGEYATYFNRDDDRDKGTVIDFIKYRNNQSLGEIRKELRPQLDSKMSPCPKTAFSSAGKNNQGSIRTYTPSKDPLKSTVMVLTHPYLTEQRCIPKEVQERFEGYIFKSIRYHKNVVFPLIGTQGVCGTDNRNKDYKNVSGVRAIWSAKDDQAKGVVIAESPINALSFIACRPSLRMNIISFCGALSNKQFDVIKQEVGNLPVCIATDNDSSGNHYKEKLIKLFPNATICQPYSHNDWNNELTNQDD